LPLPAKEYFSVANNPKELVMIAWAKHTFEDTAHQQQLFQESLAWIEKTIFQNC
jgi:hypothetical protein